MNNEQWTRDYILRGNGEPVFIPGEPEHREPEPDGMLVSVLAAYVLFMVVGAVGALVVIYADGVEWTIGASLVLASIVATVLVSRIDNQP